MHVYVKNNKIKKACQDTCVTCVKTTDTCVTCDITKNRELFNSRCDCFPRYYEVKGDTMCKGIFYINKF